ncbi:MAG: DUF1501 domain-containing protein, partial [Bacteroidota bacterium]
IGYGSSLLFQGSTGSVGVTVENVDAFYDFINNVEQPAPETRAGDKLRFLRLITRQSQQYGARIKSVAESVTNHVEYPTNNYLADQLKIVSKLIAGGSQTPVYLVRLDGFDTHDAQVGSDHTTGVHAQLLQNLNDAIRAFMQDLELHNNEDRVLGMTFSEFGRTILSNASDGTDHGAAAPMFFFGNPVIGGVVGSNPVIDSHMTYEDNLPYEFDFRQIYSSVFEQWFGLDTGLRNNLLKGDFNTVNIVGDAPLQPLSIQQEQPELFVYPNPLRGQTTVQFYGNGESTSIEVLDMSGRPVDRVFAGYPQPGLNKVQWYSDRLPKGRYFMILRSQSRRETFSIIK